VSLANIKEIFKIKEFFSELSFKKIKEIHKTINELKNERLHINMTTKGLSRRQIIVPMSNANSLKFILLLGDNIANINRELKNIKSDILADFIITTNKVAVMFNLGVIENFLLNREY